MNLIDREFVEMLGELLREHGRAQNRLLSEVLREYKKAQSSALEDALGAHLQKQNEMVDRLLGKLEAVFRGPVSEPERRLDS
jgi:hypothetical protein